MTCCCSKDKRIIIVRGNDTDFNSGNLVEFKIRSSVLTVSDFTAKITLNGIVKEYDDLSSGIINYNLSASETASLPYGDINGALYLISQSDKIATITNTIPFKVISTVSSNYIATSDVDYVINVEQGGQTIFEISVESAVSVKVGTVETLPAGSGAYVENVGTDNHLVLNFGIPRGNQGEKGENGKQGEQGIPGQDGADGQDGKNGTDGKDATINGVNTLTLTATDGLALSQSGNVASVSGKTIQDAITAEATNRSNEDNNLQSQIDAITASSDVTDIVGTYAELQSYDTSSLAPNSIIKVLQDESRNDETTYYRWVITDDVGSWVLIGEEGPYYTKGEADIRFVPQTRTVNGKALAENITLSADDVGAATSGQGAKADTALQGVQIVGTDLTVDANNKVNIPAVSINGNYGVVKLGAAVGGLAINSSGNLYVVGASQGQIAAKLANINNPVMPSQIDTAVKAGLTTNTLTLTDAEKKSACSWLGIEKITAGSGLATLAGVQYTITGTPTITTGVASGFSASNYLTTKGTLNSTLSNDGSSITFDFSVNYNSATSGACNIYTIFVNGGNYLRIYQNSVRLYVLARVANVNYLQMYTNQNVFTLNSKSYFRIKETRVSSTSYTFDVLYSTDGITYTNVGSSSLASSVLGAFNGEKIDIGIFTGSASAAYPYVNGGIDLNDFKIVNSEVALPMVLNPSGDTLLRANFANSISSSSTSEELVSAKLLYEELQKIRSLITS